MKVTKETFLKWMNRLPETATDRNMARHTMWIIPAPFRAMQYVNDGGYLLPDEAPDNEKPRREQRNNIEFYQS